MNMYGIEGNIAAGKTSLGLQLDKTGKLGFLQEPVEQWRDSKLLPLYYADPERWAFTLQIVAFNTRAKTWDEVLALTDHSKILMERSVFSDKNVFARLMCELGYMNDAERTGYNDMWDFVASKWAVRPEKIFYLDTPPEVCLARIAQRGRLEEQGIKKPFLEHLKRLHDEWLFDADDVILLDGLLSVEAFVEKVLLVIGESA